MIHLKDNFSTWSQSVWQQVHGCLSLNDGVTASLSSVVGLNSGQLRTYSLSLLSGCQYHLAVLQVYQISKTKLYQNVVVLIQLLFCQTLLGQQIYNGAKVTSGV